MPCAFVNVSHSYMAWVADDWLKDVRHIWVQTWRGIVLQYITKPINSKLSETLIWHRQTLQQNKPSLVVDEEQDMNVWIAVLTQLSTITKWWLVIIDSIGQNFRKNFDGYERPRRLWSRTLDHLYPSQLSFSRDSHQLNTGNNSCEIPTTEFSNWSATYLVYWYENCLSVSSPLGSRH